MDTERNGEMKTLICSTCGCSLVRLGITEDQSVTSPHQGEVHHFCCQGCADLFSDDPQKFLEETRSVIVCPTCLAEKPVQWAVEMNVAGQVLHFCRCPYCAEVFQKNPEFYIQRLAGTVPNEGVLDHEGCCIKPA